MIELMLFVVTLIIGYLLGSIPSGLILVKLKTGEDIRSKHSGRTGGTNAMRAAGFGIGLATAILDILKSTAAVLLARYLLPDQVWLHALAPVFAILGHNYSIFLAKRDENGRIKLSGGAGGAPCVGGSIGLYWSSAFFILPVGIIFLYFVGYASLATLSVAVASAIFFAILYFAQVTPWQYIAYGILAGALLVWALRPNLKRLREGNERIVGFRARKPKSE